MIRILYVDDEEVLLDLAKIFLERSGDFSIDTSPTAVGLIDSPTISSYDAIISDYQMPEMDGIAFLKVIRKKYPDMPFILFTGRGREEVVIEAINNGADFYLQKGGDPKAQFAELSHKVIQAVKRRKAERELSNSEERFSQIFHANPAIAGLSEIKTGRYIDVNEAFLQRLSYTREEVIGKTSLELEVITPDERDNLITALEEKGFLHNYESIVKTRTGEILHVLISADVISTRGEDFLLVQAIDITERTKSEEALKESEYRLRSFVNNTAEAVILIDEDGYIIEWNPAAEHISGIRENEAVGKYCWDIMFRMMPPSRKSEEYFLKMKNGIQNALKTGIPTSWESVSTDVTRQDGSRFYIRQISFPIPTSRGFRFGLIIEDITQRRIAEENARITLDNLHRSQSIAKVGNWSLDLKTNRYSASDEALSMFGFQPDAKPAFEDISRLIHPDDIKQVHDLFYDALKTGKSYTIEMRVIIPDTGETKYISSFGEIEFDEQGNPIRVFGVNQDVTQQKKTLRTLDEKEKQFRQILDNLPISISIVTLDGQILYANSQAMSLFGFEKIEDLYATWVPDIWVDPIKRDEWIHKLQETGIVTNFEMELNHSSGKKFWAIGFGIFITFMDQRCVLSAHHNITDSKLAREELKKSEERYRFITDNTTDVIWTTDLAGRFTYVSPSISHLRGFTPEEVMAQSLEAAISPGSRPLAMKKINTLMKWIREGKKPDPDTTIIEQPCKDGSSVWTEVVSRPLYDKWGEPIGFIGVSRDITKRKATEEALIENEEKFTSIFNQAPDPIIILDPDDKVLEVNNSFHEMFGKTDADVMGKKMSDIGILGDEKQDPDTRFQILPADYIYRKEMTFLNQEKTPFIAEIALSHIRIKGQDSILLQIHDINEIRKAHDAVRKANDKLNILSSITRHDILNRVMIASLYSEEIKESVTDPTIIRYLNAISQASADIEHLIGFTKEYQDLGTTTPAWQRVDTLLHEPTIIGLVPGIQIKSELGLLEIYADLMLEKVLYNLVDNSVRHGQNLSVIRCSFEIQDNDCILMYEDNGGGVPDSEKEKIFERGFGKNTGMGLFLISEILSITGIGITEKGKFGEGVSFQMRVPSGKWHI